MTLKKYFGTVKQNRSIRIFAGAILIRILVYLVSVCVMAVFGDYGEGITFSDFLEAWKRWDSAHYLNIAQNGYGGAIEDGKHLFLVFFPLYPWLIRALHMLVGDYRLAGILISTVCFGIGNVFLDKLMRLEFGQEEAGRAAAALAVFPFSFFFGSIMTESLYFAILSAFFWFLRRHRWTGVAAVGFLACLTKVQGVLLAFCVVVELFYDRHGFLLLAKGKWRSFVREILWPGLRCVPMVGGLLVYLYVNYAVEGDPLRFLYYQRTHWNNSLTPIWNTFSYVRAYAADSWFTSAGMSLWVPELVLFFLYLAVIVYGFRKRLRPVYLVYLTLYFLLTYSSTWLISAGRYTLSALPLFMLGGKFFADHRKAGEILLPVSLMLMMVYMIGCYQWKQIM